MKRLKMILALLFTLIIVAIMTVWTQNHSAKPWLTILIWVAVIIVLQLMFIYLIVFKNRKNKKR